MIAIARNPPSLSHSFPLSLSPSLPPPISLPPSFPLSLSPSLPLSLSPSLPLSLSPSLSPPTPLYLPSLSPSPSLSLPLYLPLPSPSVPPPALQFWCCWVNSSVKLFCIARSGGNKLERFTPANIFHHLSRLVLEPKQMNFINSTQVGSRSTHKC